MRPYSSALPIRIDSRPSRLLPVPVAPRRTWCFWPRDASHEPLDGLRLVARGLEGRHQLEVRHPPMIQASQVIRTHVLWCFARQDREEPADGLRRGLRRCGAEKSPIAVHPMGPWRAGGRAGCWRCTGVARRRDRPAACDLRTGACHHGDGVQGQQPATDAGAVVGVLLALAAGAAAFMLSSQGTESPKPSSRRETSWSRRPSRPATTIDGPAQPCGPCPSTTRTPTPSPTERRSRADRRHRHPPARSSRPTCSSPTRAGAGPDPQADRDGLARLARSARRQHHRPLRPRRRRPHRRGPARRPHRHDARGRAVPVDPLTGLAATTPRPASHHIQRGILDEAHVARRRDPRAQPGLADLYILRIDLQTAEEIAHAQNQGASSRWSCGPPTDTRDVDRSTYGETTDTLVARYNFRVPEAIDGLTYPQPIDFPSPFPAEPYLSPRRSPRRAPESAITEARRRRPRPRVAPPGRTAAR